MTETPAIYETEVRDKGAVGIQLRTMAEAKEFAVQVAKSGLAPKGIQTPEAIMIAIQLGAEIGLPPMASLQNIAVINGRPGIYGDAALAVVRSSGLLAEYSETGDGQGDEYGYTVRSVRRGGGEIVTRFTVADAKRAKLWGKQGPWSEYPDRMLKFRARGFNLRDNFGDVLKGMATVEEIRDTPKDITREARDVTPPKTTKKSAAEKVSAAVPDNATPDWTAERIIAEVGAPEDLIVGYLATLPGVDFRCKALSELSASKLARLGAKIDDLKASVAAFADQ